METDANMARTPEKLSSLLRGLDVLEAHGDLEVRIASVTYDSREVAPGALFAALPGFKIDGHAFLSSAAERGAAAALVSVAPNGPAPPVWVRVQDTREALAILSARFFADPSLELDLVGITGTKGKTTLTYLLESILLAASRRPGVIGTVDVRWAGRSAPSEHTTPEAPDLQAWLRRMRKDGVDAVSLEVSSHALELQRVRGAHFRVGVFTNLSRDHLDFHGDMARYARAKALLFERELVESAARDKVAVVNAADPASAAMVAGFHGRVIRFGPEADVRPIGPYKSDLAGTRVRIALPDGALVEIESALSGRHNLENLLAAVASAFALGLPPDAIALGIRQLRHVPGRLERVVESPAVFVDYAHTDQALRSVLSTLRPLTSGRLITVFGCGGDRDRGKRPLMGAAVAQASDLAVVTSDNPRSEDPLAILAEIVPGMEAEGAREVPGAALAGAPDQSFAVVPDRRAAIELAVSLSQSGDAVLIAGKGHETYQIEGALRRHFDDREEARRAFSEHSADPPRFTAEQIAFATAGRLVQGKASAPVDQVFTDTRESKPGGLFVALRGPNFDGASFCRAAAAAGARAVLVAETGLERASALPAEVAVIAVADPLRALGDLCMWHRRRYRAPLVAITGSNGKTTTKEMTAAVLGGAPDVLWNKSNLNNLIGMPRSLLELGPEHRFAVMEMGMNAPGEIRRLGEIAGPRVGVITNVHPVHLEGLGTLQAVAEAKGELLETLPADGVAVLCADDPLVLKQRGRTRARAVTFGKSPAADVRCFDVDARGAKLRFGIEFGGERIDVLLPRLGAHNAVNAAAAAAVGFVLGIGANRIAERLALARPAPMRLEVVACGEAHLLLDCYNANPRSVEAALAALAGLEASARYAILGDMRELGDASDQLHRQVGHGAAQAGLNGLCAFGPSAQAIAAAAGEAGMAEVAWTDDVHEAVRWADARVAPGAFLLIKGSRGMRMERIAIELLGARGIPWEPGH